MTKFLPLFLAVCLVFSLAITAQATDYRELQYSPILVRDGVQQDIFNYLAGQDLTAIVYQDLLYISDTGFLVVDGVVKTSNVTDLWLYQYNRSLAVWEYVAFDSWDTGSKLTNLSDVKWSYHDLHDSNGVTVFAGETAFLSYYQTYDQAVLDATEDAYNSILSDAETLLVVGLAIMAVFVGLSLVPRIIYKFL